MSKQTRFQSLLEAKANTFSGLVISYALTLTFNYTPLVLFGHTILYIGDGLTPLETLNWTLIMTAVSIVRGYTWRRLFNNRNNK